MNISFRLDASHIAATGSVLDTLFAKVCDYLEFFVFPFLGLDEAARANLLSEKLLPSESFDWERLDRGELLEDFLSDQEVISGARLIMSFDGDSAVYPRAASLSRCVKRITHHQARAYRVAYHRVTEFEKLARLSGSLKFEFSEDRRDDVRIMESLLDASTFINFPNGPSDFSFDEIFFKEGIMPISPRKFDDKEAFNDALYRYVQEAWEEFFRYLSDKKKESGENGLTKPSGEIEKGGLHAV